MSLENNISFRPVIIGSNGQLGQALMELTPNAIGLTRDEIDLSKSGIKNRLKLILENFNDIHGIINAAAYTAVDKAETEKSLAHRVNGTAPGQIAQFCQEHKLPFVHISTDYVFAGDTKIPYEPEDKTSPLNVYGLSKRKGEEAVQETIANACILRTSWVYDRQNNNFLTTMLRLAETQDTLSIVSDQIGRPTYTGDLASAAMIALKKLAQDSSKAGIYHISNTGNPISWADFAIAIFKSTGKKVIVTPISTKDYPTPAKRPAYSVMNTSKFEKAFNHKLPSWKDALSRALTH